GTLQADTLTGDAGVNFLFGDDGNDDITGGLGADELSGGSGSDHFIYQSGDSTAASLDMILDFEAGGNGTGGIDIIDISALVSGTFTMYEDDTAFGESFGNTQAMFTSINSNTKMLEIDTDGDAITDQEIQVTIMDGGVLDQTDLHTTV
ncbi:MAG: M10 family metallopeptidase C-terminal domain-containing protein, partial [Rhodospirillales bacterium]|nr:M10 family metallopeptidase C-terminal domain-containing protein [Rhodospirillales bacterium]